MHATPPQCQGWVPSRRVWGYISTPPCLPSGVASCARLGVGRGHSSMASSPSRARLRGHSLKARPGADLTQPTASAQRCPVGFGSCTTGRHRLSALPHPADGEDSAGGVEPTGHARRGSVVRDDRAVRHQPRDGAPIEDLLRRRWLLAIEQLGPEAAIRDAAEVFALRFGCTASEGRAIALRAWRTLSLPGSPG